MTQKYSQFFFSTIEIACYNYCIIKVVFVMSRYTNSSASIKTCHPNKL